MYNLPNFENYMDSSSKNYGLNSLVFTDIKGNRFYYSYKTLIAVYIPKKDLLLICKNEWSTTTGKHLNAINPDKKIRLDYSDFIKKIQENI